MQPSWENTLPHILCFNSSLKYLDNCIYAHFLRSFTDAKTTTKWKKLTTWWSWACTRPAGIWGWRMVKPVTPPCNLTISQTENHAQADLKPSSPLPHLAFKMCWLEKKKAHHESCELSFIWGRTRTTAQETAFQIALRDCFKEVGRGSVYMWFWGKQSIFNQAHIFCNWLLLFSWKLLLGHEEQTSSWRVFFFFSFFWLHQGACGIFVPRLGIEPMPVALETQF